MIIPSRETTDNIPHQKAGEMNNEALQSTPEPATTVKAGPPAGRGRQIVAAGGLLLLAMAMANAQDGTATIEEITVTAQKREQNLQDVPMAITALSESKLEQLNIQDMASYVKVVPGLNYIDRGPTGRRGGRPLSLRGVYSDSGEPTVGFYVNEVPVPAFDPVLFDVNRIEVLRGPQGTLYGASSMGGTIKVVTNQPDPTAFSSAFDASLSYTDAGGFNTTGSAMVNLPLADGRAALRVSAVSRYFDGYIDNLASGSVDAGSTVVDTAPLEEDKNHNTEHVNGFRASLLYLPSDRLTVTPSILFQQTDVGARDTYLSSLDGLESSFRLDTGTTEENFLADVTIDYAGDRVEVVSNTSWYDTEFDDPDDLTELERSFVPATPPIAQENIGDTQILTQELRFLSTPDSLLAGSIEWTAGIFYTDRTLDRRSREAAAGFGQATRDDILFLAGEFGLTPDEVASILFGVNFDQVDDLAFASQAAVESSEIAVFGEATAHLGDHFELLLGLRWFETDFKQTLSADGLFNGGPSGPTSSSSSDSGVNPKLSLSYRSDNGQLLYSTVAKGYRAGGANLPLGSTCDADLADLGLSGVPEGFDADSLWSYEVGGKLDFANSRLRVNAAAFYIDWEDIQQSVLLPSCFQSFTGNVGKAHSQGAELEVTASASDSLQFGLAVSFTEAEFDEANEGLGIDVGDPVQIIPEWKVNANVEYLLQIGSLDGFVRADYQYLSDATFGFDFDRPEVNDRPGYDIAGLQFGTGRDNWEVVLFVDNLLNERPRLGVLDFGTAVGSDDLFINTLRPRTMGLRVRADFN